MTYSDAAAEVAYEPGTVTARSVAIFPTLDGHVLYVTHTLTGRALQIALYASPRVRARHALAIMMEARTQAGDRGYEVAA